jgi:serine/threonine protein kinase
MVMGSPSYIAPETWRGNSAALDGRADLFALAVIVFRWLSGSLPFEAPDLIGKMTAVTSGPRPSLVRLRADLPAAVDAWMSRALAVEPSDRFQSGGELYSALEAALRGETWPQASADTSGMRNAADPPAALDTGERQSTLASAWRAAGSLLKRFTAPRDRETPVATPPPATPPLVSTPAPVAPAAVWLPSEELEDAVDQPAASAEPKAKAKAGATPSKRGPKPKPRTKTKAKSKKQARKVRARQRKA